MSEKVSARVKVCCHLLWRQRVRVFAQGLGDVKTAHHDTKYVREEERKIILPTTGGLKTR